MQVTQETRVQSLGWEDPLEEGMATHSSILAWRTPWTAAYQAPPFMGFSRQEYWSGVPLPLEAKIEKDTCIPLFTEALFTIAGTWKQPRCPSTDEWIKK